MKRGISAELVEKAAKSFAKWGGHLPTGADGLTRGELRSLERAGLVEKKYGRLSSGTMICVWYWRGPK